MLSRVISGGQTGVDQAGWRVAQRFGIPTGGAMSLGFITDDGPMPEFAGRYGACELETGSPRARTRRNVQESDATLWFGSLITSGARTTIDACQLHDRPHFLVAVGGLVRPSRVATWVRETPVRVLNVAGNRESESPGIGANVETFLTSVFRILQLRNGKLAEFLSVTEGTDGAF